MKVNYEILKTSEYRKEKNSIIIKCEFIETDFENERKISYYDLNDILKSYNDNWILGIEIFKFIKKNHPEWLI